MDVYLKSSKNAVKLLKWFINQSKGFKSYNHFKISFLFWANFFAYYADISTDLWDPLRCSDFAQIFVGDS